MFFLTILSVISISNVFFASFKNQPRSALSTHPFSLAPCPGCQDWFCCKKFMARTSALDLLQSGPPSKKTPVITDQKTPPSTVVTPQKKVGEFRKGMFGPQNGRNIQVKDFILNCRDKVKLINSELKKGVKQHHLSELPAIYFRPFIRGPMYNDLLNP